MHCQVFSVTGMQDVATDGERLGRFEHSMRHFWHSLIGADRRSIRDVAIELRYVAHASGAHSVSRSRIETYFFIRSLDRPLLGEVADLFDLSLFDGGIDYRREDNFDEVAVPYSATDSVFFARRLSRSRPVETLAFESKPDAYRLCNILLRQGVPCSLHVLARPCNFDRNDRFTLEHLWGKEGFAVSPQEPVTDGTKSVKIPPFLMNLRLSSSEPIQNYLANSIGSELAGGYSFITWRPDDLDGATVQSWFKTGTLQSVPLPVSDAPHLPQVVTEAYNTYSEQEILRAFRLPDQGLPGYKQKFYTRLPVPSDVLATDGILLGYGSTSSRREEVPVLLSPGDRRRHLYILGQTGTGKSTLLLNLVLQDIAAGHGGCIIDPHGDLITDILSNVDDSVVDSGRLVLFDPTDERLKPGLNLLEVSPTATEREREYVVNELVSTFIRLFNEEVFGPRIQHYFRNACITMMESEYPGTLVDVPRLFTNESFRMNVLKTVNKAFVKEFWIEEFKKTGSREREEMIPYFNAKFGPIVGSYLVRYIIGQPKSTIDVHQIMRSGQTLLVPLSKGVIGGMNSTLLGSFMVNKVVASMFARATMPESERRDFYLYVDEFQNFVSQTFGEVLSEARKFNVSLTISHQFIDQLSGDKPSLGNRVKHAVFGNVGNSLFFRIGAGDIEEIAKVLHGVPKDFAASMVNLENFFAVAKILTSGQPTYPFTITTPRVYLPVATGDPRRTRAAEVRRHLLTKFGVPLEEIQPVVDRPGEW